MESSTSIAINVLVNPNLINIIENRKIHEPKLPCLYRILDVLLNFGSLYHPNLMTSGTVNGTIDIVLEPVARNVVEKPNLTLTLPFGSTTCFITHTIEKNDKSSATFDSMSFMSTEVVLFMTALILIGTIVVLGSRKARNLFTTFWFTLLLIFNQSTDSQLGKLRKYAEIVLTMLIVSIGIIKAFFGANFSVQLTLTDTFPKLNSLDQLSTWNVTTLAAQTGVCYTLIYGMPNSKEILAKQKPGVSINMMGEGETGKVISFDAGDRVESSKSKMCHFYPDKKLHVSPSIGQTTVALIMYMYVKSPKKEFLEKFMTRLMEMGIGQVVLKCDNEVTLDEGIGPWKCANQSDENFQSFQQIPLIFYKKYLIFMFGGYGIIIIIETIVQLSMKKGEKYILSAYNSILKLVQK